MNWYANYFYAMIINQDIQFENGYTPTNPSSENIKMKNRKKSTIRKLILLFATTFAITYAAIFALADSPEMTSNRLNYSFFLALSMIGLYFVGKFFVIVIDSFFRFVESRFWRKIRKPLKYICIFACVILFFMKPILILIPLAPLLISSFLAPDTRSKEEIEQEQRNYEDFMDDVTGQDTNKQRRRHRHPFKL